MLPAATSGASWAEPSNPKDTAITGKGASVVVARVGIGVAVGIGVGVARLVGAAGRQAARQVKATTAHVARSGNWVPGRFLPVLTGVFSN